MKSAKQTVFVGPQEIAGFLSRISEALASEGLDVIAFKQIHTVHHPQPSKEKNIFWLFPKTIKTLSKWNPVLRSPFLFFVKFCAFITALSRADACLFIGGKGFFNIPIDYYLLRLFGKRVIHMYVGSASRPRFFSIKAKEKLDTNFTLSAKNSRQLARKIKSQFQRVQRTSNAATLVIENPLCGHFQSRPFINYFRVGLPIEMNPAATLENQKSTTSRKIQIFHCPSNPSTKGTSQIQKILTPEKLKEFNAELIIKTGISHSQVLEEISKSDLILDQLYSDSPLAGFAAEAASLGRIPIVGGYGWSQLKGLLPPEEIPPSILCHPDDLLETIRAACTEHTKRRQQASMLESFLTKGSWSAKTFAHRLSLILFNEVPQEWLVEPNSISYFNGVGLSDKEASGIVSSLVNHEGLESLQLSKNPDLETRISDWIHSA